MKNGKLAATLVHIGTNMWFEIGNSRGQYNYNMTYKKAGSDTLRLDRELWDKYMVELKEAGNNALVLDIGDGVVFDSHPEIAVKGAWSRKELENEVKKLKEMGFKLIPKLNFSATHDTWMKEYSKMLSTQPYYDFCRDVIAEVCEIFEPEYFHIGMDEEGYEMQADYDYIVIRQADTWWHDLYFLVDEVEKHGARAVMWSDYARHKPEEFIEKCPRSVVQAVWYYHDRFYGELEELYACRVKPFKQLADAGFDIFASGSTCVTAENLPMLTEYCKKTVPEDQLIGICQTVWEAVTPEWEYKFKEANDAVRKAISVYNA